MRFRSLLTLAVVLPLLATAMAVIAAMYLNANARSQDMAEKLLASATARAGEQVRDYHKDAANLAHAMSALARDGLILADSDRLTVQLLGLLRAHPGMTWISFSNPAGDFTGVYRDTLGRTCTNQSRIADGKTALVEFVVDDQDRRTPLRTETDSGYDPRKRDFYMQAVAGRDVTWLPPYVFFGQNIPGITCAIAVRAPDGTLAGVFSVDYDLLTLSTFARQSRTSDRSQVMVFDASEVLVAHSSANFIRTTSTQNAGLLRLADVDDPVTAAFQKHMHGAPITSAGGAQFYHFAHGGEAYLGCVMPVSLDNGPRQYVAAVAPVHDFAPTAWESSGGALVIILFAIVVAGVVAMSVAYGITRPISALVAVSERIGKGDLNVPVRLGPILEFKRLARAFEQMLANLRDWMRVRTSLQLAMEIQRNLLPAGPPTVPGFDIAGFSVYCDETGGDYFDYILVDREDERCLVVALGDVMGHGLPSALLMAGARGILRSSVQVHADPGALLSRLNVLLYQDTGGTRFMTMVLVAFDLDARSFNWAAAGHEAPLIFDPSVGTFVELEGGDVPLGVIDAADYATYVFEPIRAGQIIFIGSDGVWEMFSEAGEAYGKERLQRVIAANAAQSAGVIKQCILSSLTDFRGAAATKDDVTFVVIKIQGPGNASA